MMQFSDVDVHLAMPGIIDKEGFLSSAHSTAACYYLRTVNAFPSLFCLHMQSTTVMQYYIQMCMHFHLLAWVPGSN